MGRRIENKDIVQPKLLDNTIEEAKVLIKTLDKLEKGLRDVLKVSRKISKTAAFKTFKDIKKAEESIKRVTSASKKLTSVQRQRKQLVDQLNKSQDEQVKGRIRLANVTKVQKDELKDLVALENKEIGTEERLLVKNRQLRRERSKLNTSTKKGAARLEEINRKLRKNTALLSKNSDKLKRSRSGMDKFKDSIKSVGVAIVATFSLVAISSFIDRIVEGSGELSDALSDVRKTTGLTQKAVDDLSNSLSELNTRTSKIDLLKIVTAGGRLGIAEKDLLGFAAAMDKVVVALGDELGGDADQIATDLAKISSVFGVEETFGVAEGITKLGSAINFLGANTKAQSGFLVDFAKRLGPVRAVANITATDILGLGATLDELGQSVEVAGTATTQVLLKLGKDTSKFAAAANIDLQEFTNLVNTDINEALLVFAQGITKSNKSTTGLTKALKGLGIDGVRSSNVLLAIASNTDKVRENQKKANDSFVEGTSILEEFNIKNNNLAANLEKLAKRVKERFTNAAVAEFLTGLTARLLGADVAAKRLGNRFKDLTKEAKSQARTLDPLIKRYDELKTQCELNKDEQIELEGIIQDIAIILPRAVTEFDKYGKALDINRKKVDENVNSSRKYRALLASEDIDKARKNIDKFTKSNKIAIKELNTGERVVKGYRTQWSNVADTMATLTDKELNELGKENGVIDNLNALIFQQLTLIEELGGELTELEKIERDKLKVLLEITEATKEEEKAVKKKNEGTVKTIGLTKEELKARQRLAKQIEDLEIDIIEDDLIRQLARLELENERETNFLRQQLEDKLITKEQFGKAELLLDKKLDIERQDAVDEANQEALAKAEQQAEKEAKIRDDIQSATLDKIGQNIKDASNDRIDTFDDEIKGTIDVQSRLLKKANEGVLGAQESLALESQKQAQLELQRKKEQEKQERLLAAFKIISALIESGEPVESALPKTAALLEVVPAVINALPSFDVGTKSVDTNGMPKADSKGGIQAIIHEKERILTKEQNAMMGGVSNWEAANIVAQHNADSKSLSPRSDTPVNPLLGFSAVVKAIESIPETTIEYDVLSKIITDRIKRGDRITNMKRRNR